MKLIWSGQIAPYHALLDFSYHPLVSRLLFCCVSIGCTTKWYSKVDVGEQVRRWIICLMRKLWVCKFLIKMMSSELEVDHLNLNVVTYIRPHNSKSVPQTHQVL